MPHKNTTHNDDGYQYHHIVIGDVILHSEIKSTPIQVIVRSLITTPSQTFHRQNIPRLVPSSSRITNNQQRISCDLKNPTTVKLTYERTLSSKKLMLMHKAGWELVKELKSKVITINKIESKISTGNTDSNNERTHF